MLTPGLPRRTNPPRPDSGALELEGSLSTLGTPDTGSWEISILDRYASGRAGGMRAAERDGQGAPPGHSAQGLPNPLDLRSEVAGGLLVAASGRFDLAGGFQGQL